ncbi:tetratricopeptide repeat-containing sulfotransferase family protein [Elongatibacter sediminis]|uniref:Sulfotransferase n=1 Tax=Elongatibacter sediminis TaxID=3119006 RepID=A0AAW9R9X6_9GAMM
MTPASDPTHPAGPSAATPDPGSTGAAKDSAEEALRRSLAAQNLGDFAAMLAAAEHAWKLDPDHPDTALRLAECRLFCSDVAGAIRLLGEREKAAGHDVAQLLRIAERYTQCARHTDALRCARRAADQAPGNPQSLYNLAAACIAAGEIHEAETLLTEVIRLNPRDYDAWYNRSTLRRRSTADNHIDELRYVLAHLDPDEAGLVPVCYALARELEDLERHDEAFDYLQRGAQARRRRLSYQVEDDLETLRQITNTFDAARMAQAPALESPGCPVFVIGLPRSGTTLVDRIIGTHSQATSLGEINMLAYGVMHAVSETTGGAQNTAEPGAPGSDPARSKPGFVAASSGIDMARLGARYRQALQGFGENTPRLVDKTPLNGLYLGLIRLALPEARIIHVRRHPVDSCLAMYKTLFRMGYPFSYRLQDVGRYVIGWHRLMDHWREVAGDGLLDVDYENLVGDPEAETRRVLDFLGLPFEAGCLRFHESTAPAATASAAQVREPIHSRSVGLWRRYARQLGPLAARLKEHGLEFD